MLLLLTGGKLSMLVQGLDGPMLDGPEAHRERRASIVNYFVRTFRLHDSYVYKFIFCEMLNIVNVLTQVKRKSSCLGRNNIKDYAYCTLLDLVDGLVFWRPVHDLRGQGYVHLRGAHRRPRGPNEQGVSKGAVG